MWLICGRPLSVRVHAFRAVSAWTWLGSCWLVVTLSDQPITALNSNTTKRHSLRLQNKTKKWKALFDLNYGWIRTFLGRFGDQGELQTWELSTEEVLRGPGTRTPTSRTSLTASRAHPTTSSGQSSCWQSACFETWNIAASLKLSRLRRRPLGPSLSNMDRPRSQAYWLSLTLENTVANADSDITEQVHKKISMYFTI